MRRIWLVTVREVIAGATKRAFIVASAIMMVLIVVGAVAIDFFGTRALEEAQVRTLGITDDLAELAPAVVAAAATLGVEVETTTVPDRSAAAVALEEGDIDAFLSGSPGELDLLFQDFPDGVLTRAVTGAAETATLTDQIADLGGDPTTVALAVQASTPTVSSLRDTSALEGPRYVVAMISVALLFFALVNSGSQIAIGVVEEKSSRVVEILLAALRPTQLFAGKVLGNGILGLAQVLLYGLTVLGAAVTLGLLEGVELNVGGQLAWLVLWFVLGFAIYAVLWGSLASLVSRQEDIGTITAPVTVLMLVPFYTAVFLVPANPDGEAARILSLIPLFSPFMMPMRTAFTSVPAWELAVAVAACLALIPLLVWLAASVYQRGILHTGSRLTFRQALRRT